MDNTFVRGSKPIDTTAITSELMKYMEGCRLLYENEIVLSDYRSYLVDINFESYFSEQLSS